MKKTVMLLVAVMLLCTCIPIAAMATGLDQDWALSGSDQILPIDVFRDPDAVEIRKVYELETHIDPGLIPLEAFERDGILYECSDILREVVIGDQTRSMTETETLESPKNDMDTVLGLLPESKDIATDDGFFGVLRLKPSTISVEASGYGSSFKTVTVSRSYPNLSDADTQYIPKTVSDGGITYTLSDIQWQSDNTYNVDDYEITNRYTALATYSGSKSTRYVKGYVVTAEYAGEVCRTGVSSIRYTVIFTGSAIPRPEPESEPSDEAVVAEEQRPKGGIHWSFIAVPGVAALGVVGVLFYRKSKKEGC